MNINEAIRQYRASHQLSTPEEGGRMGEAFLFDMDGVLYDSMPFHAVAWQQATAKYGIKMTAADAYATEGAKGVDTIRHFARLQLGQELDEPAAQEIYDEKTRIFHSMGEAPIFDGVADVMQQLKAHGRSIGIVTGSGQRPLIQRLLHDFGAFIDEAHIVTAYNVSRGKPAPDPYLKGLCQASNLQPWQGVVIENAPLGVRAGVAAGCFTVAINSGPLPDEALLTEGAHVLYPSMRAFFAHLEALLGA